MNRDSTNPSQAQVSQGNKPKDEQSKEEEDLNLNKAEQEGTTSASRGKNTQGLCKPKATNTLRVIISDLELQAYRDHMVEHAVIFRFMGF